MEHGATRRQCSAMFGANNLDARREELSRVRKEIEALEQQLQRRNQLAAAAAQTQPLAPVQQCPPKRTAAAAAAAGGTAAPAPAAAAAQHAAHSSGDLATSVASTSVGSSAPRWQLAKGTRLQSRSKLRKAPPRLKRAASSSSSSKDESWHTPASSSDMSSSDTPSSSSDFESSDDELHGPVQPPRMAVRRFSAPNPLQQTANSVELLQLLQHEQVADVAAALQALRVRYTGGDPCTSIEIGGFICSAV